MNNITPVYRDIVKYTSQNGWVRGAIMIAGATATAAIGAYYLTNRLFSKRVSFGREKVIDIQSYKSKEFPSGYFVQHPDKGPCIVIVEKVRAEIVTLRFQDNKNKIEPGDRQFLSKEEFDSWGPAKIW